MRLTREHLVFLLFIHLSGNAFAANKSADTKVAGVAYNLCKYNTFCRSESRSIPEGSYSCCADCSCSDNCYLANKCCPDADVKNQDTEMTCRYQYEYFDQHRNIKSRPRYSTYYIIDSCNDIQDEDIVDGCLQPTAIEDHVLVSDKNTTKVYKNGKCALCNGVKHYETWDLIALCVYDDALFSIEKRIKHVLEQCSLLSQPPNKSSHLYESMKCSPQMIDKCNITRLWDFYDKDIERACRQYNMVYTEESYAVRGYRTYKNVYCFLCNNKNGTIPSPQCFQEGAARKDDLLHSSPFSSVISFAQLQPLEKKMCKTDEIEDPFFGACTRLYCPFGMTVANGACVATTRETFVSLVALYTIDVSYSTNEEPGSTTNTDVFKPISEVLKNRFGRANCDICELKMFSGNIFLIRARPNDQCSLMKILKVFRNISLMSVTMQNIYNASIQIRQTGKHSIEPRIGIGILKINGLDTIAVVKEHSCFPGARLLPKFFCERIVFSLQRLVESSMTKKVLEQLLAVSDVYEYKGNVTDKYVVCLSDYRKLVRNAASSVENRGVLTLVLYVLVLLSNH